MQSDDSELPRRAVFFTHEFKRNLRQLAKKYRRIQKDIAPILADIQTGNLPGDQITGVIVEVYKVRARNSDSTRGKSGGYRIIYQKRQDESIVLITMYSKTEQSDISPNEIQAILNEYEQESVEDQETGASESFHEETDSYEKQATLTTEIEKPKEDKTTDSS